MGSVTARPAALRAYADTLLSPDARLRDDADRLRGTLYGYLSRNADFAHDHTQLVDGLQALSDDLVALDQRVGTIAEAFHRVDDGGGVVRAWPYVLNRHLDDLDAPITDLRDVLLPISDELWHRLLFGSWECPPWLAGGYRGGGALRGPDGRMYPLVVPELRIGDDIFHASTGSDPSTDPLTLGGTDDVWVRLFTLTGIARFGDPPSGAEKMLVGMHTATGGPTPGHRWLSPDALAHLRIGPTGWPSFPPMDLRSPSARPVDPQVDLPEPGPFHASDGPSARRHRAAGRGAGAADLAIGMAEGYEFASTMDHANHAGYQIVLEEDPESGRRRAVARTYTAAHESGPINIIPEIVHMEDDGLVRTPQRFHHDDHPTIGPSHEAHHSIVLERHTP